MQLTTHVPAPLSYWLLTQLASVATDDIAMGVALGSEGRENLPSATSDIWTSLLLLLVAFFLREWRQKNLRNINECFRISFLELSSATKKNYWRVHTFRCVAWFHCQVILGLGYNLFFLYIYIYFFGRGENAASGFVLNTCLPHNPKMSRVVQKLEGYKFRSGSSFSNWEAITWILLKNSSIPVAWLTWPPFGVPPLGHVPPSSSPSSILKMIFFFLNLILQINFQISTLPFSCS